MLKTYKYEIYPDVEQQQQLENQFGAIRFIYNWGLDKKIKSYAQDNRTISCFDLIKELTELKKAEEYQWLNEIYSQSLQMSLRNLDNAFTAFFRKQNKFPQFKSRKYSKKTIQYPQGVYLDFEQYFIHIPKVGKVILCKDRQFQGTIKTCTVSKSSTNKYYISVLFEDNQALPKKPKIIVDKTVGIDLGIKHLLTISNGVKIENPKHLKQSEQRLKVNQRRLSKKQKGSKNYDQQKLLLSEVHERISNQRKDLLHKLTYSLTHDSQVDSICMEDLNVDGMLKNHCLAKAIGDCSWQTFKTYLQYKTEWYSKNLIFIGRFEPSSKICSICGYNNKDLTLDIREWTCPICNTTHDRDFNASQNIKNFGLINKLGGDDTTPSINKIFLSDSTVVESEERREPPLLQLGEYVRVNTICKNCQSSGTKPIVKGRYVECWFPDSYPRNAENETLRVDSVKHPVEEAIKEFMLGSEYLENKAKKV